MLTLPWSVNLIESSAVPARPLIAKALAGIWCCLTLISGDVLATDLDRDCRPDVCADIEVHIDRTITQLRGASSSEKAGLMARVRRLESQLATCQHAHPLRRASAPFSAWLQGMVSIEVLTGNNFPNLKSSRRTRGAEITLQFTNNGCTAALSSLVSGIFAGPQGRLGPTVRFDPPTASSGEYHPVSGAMTLHFTTAVDFAPGLGSVSVTPGSATFTLRSSGPHSQNHLHLVGDGVVTGGNSSVPSIQMVIDGTISQLPGPM